MEFQVLAHRRVKRKTISLISLVLLIPVSVFLLSQFYLALLVDFGLRPKNIDHFNSGGPAGLVIISVISFFVYTWRLRRQQHRLQYALQSFDLKGLTNDSEIGLFLYLRSFKMGRSTMLRRLVPFAYGDQSLLGAIFGGEAFLFEEDISNAVSPYGLLIAIGDRNDSYGAGKIITTDEKWKDTFHWLASHSWMIFVQPDLTQSVKWEISQLVRRESCLRKTVWVMPQSGGEKWAEVRDGLLQDGVVLPQHRAGGGMFRLHPSSGEMPVGPNAFTATLNRLLEEANYHGRALDVEDLWEQALADDKVVRAPVKAFGRYARRSK